MILPFSLSDWDEAALCAWEEKSAQLEYDARMLRKEAERIAEEMTRQSWALEPEWKQVLERMRGEP